jgi:hypothetical protein
MRTLGSILVLALVAALISVAQAQESAANAAADQPRGTVVLEGADLGSTADVMQDVESSADAPAMDTEPSIESTLIEPGNYEQLDLESTLIEPAADEGLDMDSTEETPVSDEEASAESTSEAEQPVVESTEAGEPAVESTEAPVVVTGVPLDERKTLLDYLPTDGFYGGLALDGPVRFYDSTSLYEYIDGQAEGFIAYRFKALESATYKDGDNSIVVDVYDMERPIQAFGLYSTFRAPSNDFVDIGLQGFKTSEGYMFCKGAMVVKISADYPDETSLWNAAKAAAGAVARRITDDRTGLEILDLLPKEGMVANSTKYYLTAALGQSFLTNGVVAEYVVPGGTARLFVCDMGVSQAAIKAYGDYLAFATGSGKVTEIEKGREFSSDVKYYGQTVVMAVDKFVAGGVSLPADWAPLIAKLKESITPSGDK